MSSSLETIPEAFGFNAGDFLPESSWMYSHIFLSNSSQQVYLASWSDQAIGTVGYDAGEYDRRWKGVNPYTDHFRGFLVGFPKLDTGHGSTVDCLHFWESNSSINDGMYAVPLTAVKGLYVYSRLRTRLQADLEETAIDGESRLFEIPILRDKKSGDVHWRSARHEDIERVIQDLDEAPIAVRKGYSGGIKRYRTVDTKEQLAKLLK